MARWSILVFAALVTAGTVATAGRAVAATLQRDCLVDSVGVIEGRMHIKCAPIPANAYTSELLYYAMNLSEGAAKLQSIVMLAIESKRRNKAMRILFDNENYTSVPGCQGNNCRLLKGAIME